MWKLGQTGKGKLHFFLALSREKNKVAINFLQQTSPLVCMGVEMDSAKREKWNLAGMAVLLSISCRNRVLAQGCLGRLGGLGGLGCPSVHAAAG